MWAGDLDSCVKRSGSFLGADDDDDDDEGAEVTEDSEGLPEGRIATGSATAEESAMVAVAVAVVAVRVRVVLVQACSPSSVVCVVGSG